MLHTFKIRFFISICISASFLFADAVNKDNSTSANTKGQYYCRANKGYQNYLKGMTKNLDGVKGFDTQQSCEEGCVFQRTCDVVAKDVKNIKITDSKSINLQAINDFLIKNASKIVGLELKIDGDTYDFRSDNVLGLMELFKKSILSEMTLQKIKVKATPNTFEMTFFENSKAVGLIQIDRNSLRSEAINASYFTKDKKDWTSITTKYFDEKTKKVLEKTEIKKGKTDFYSLLGIIKTNSSVTYGGFTIPLQGNIDNQSGEKTIYYNGSTENKIKIGNQDIKFLTKTNGKDLNKDTKYLINFNGKEYDNFEIDGLIKNTKDLFYCPYNTSTKNNIFSSQKACDNACSVPTSCQFEEPKTPSDDDCTTEEQLLDGVGDSDGKFIYETKKIITTCKRTRKKQTGCELYDIKTVFAPKTPDYLKNLPDVETNLQDGDFNKGIATFTKASAADQIAHMFSGEANYCDYDFFLDKPNWTEMGIKYGMMVLGPLFSQGQYGEAYKAGKDVAQKAGENSFNATLTGFGKGTWANIKSYAKEIAENFTRKGWEKASEQMAKNFMIWDVSFVLQQGVQAIVQGKKNDISFISNGASAGASKEHIKTYEELGGAHDKDDKKAADYAKCMTNKFRLYPSDIMNYHLGVKPDDIDDPEERERIETLYFPWSSYVTITGEDFGVLYHAMQDNNADSKEEKDSYFNAHYRIKGYESTGNKKLYLKSLTGDDYMIAAETICGGKDEISWIRQKYGKRFMNPDLRKDPNEKNIEKSLNKAQELSIFPAKEADDEFEENNLKKVSKMALDMVFSSLPSPFNLLASMVSDYVQLFSKGNTCIDESFAKERKQKDSKNGDMYVKTNKRIASDLCVETGNDPKFDEVFIGLYRKRNYYCCYDQKLTKIFAQGITTELGRDLNANTCSNITPEDLDKISFNECKKGEDPEKDKCFPRDKFDELSQTILQGGSIGSDDLLKNIVKSTLQLKEKLYDPLPLDPNKIIDTGAPSDLKVDK